MCPFSFCLNSAFQLNHKTDGYIFLHLKNKLTCLFILFSWIFAPLAGEKGRVRKCIMEGRQAIETKNIFACSAMISENYHDKYGNDRAMVIYAAKETFSFYKKITIRIEKMEIRLNESKNEADGELVASILCQSEAGKTENIFEKEKGRFRLKLIKEDKKWYVTEVEFLEALSIVGKSIR